MSNYTREPSFGNTTKITSRQLTLTGNSGFDCLLNATRPLTIEAPIIQFSTYPDQSNTTGTINFLKSDGTTVMAVETESNQLNMSGNKMINVGVATAGTDAVNKSQMDSAIATAIGGVSGFSIARGGGSVTAETTGQITVSPPVGQATIMTVAGVTKATINTSNLTMAVPIAMGSNKITGLTTATNNDEATNKGQMDSAIATALTPYLTSATAGTTYATQASVATAIAQSHPADSITRGSAFVIAEASEQITYSAGTAKQHNFQVGSVQKATLTTSNLSMTVPIAMGSNKITGLTSATNNDEAVNKGQMDTAIAGAVGGITSYSIARAGGSVTAETTGFITYNGAVGTGHTFKVNGVNKSYIGDNTHEYYTDVVNYALPANGYMAVTDSGGVQRFIVDTNTGVGGSQVTSRFPLSMNTTNKIINLATGTATTDAVNKGQMDTAVANAHTITRASGTVSVGTSGEITNTALTGQFVDTFVGSTRYIRTNANNGTGFSTNIKVPSVSFTTQPIYLSGPALGSNMDIYFASGNNIIAGGDVLKTLLIDFATTAIKGKASGGIPFALYDYLGTNTKMNYDEGNDKLNVFTANGIAMNSKKITGLANATANDEAVNKGQMDTAIASAVGGVTTFSITRGGGSVTAETTGQISINPALGQTTVMSVAGVTKATLNTANLTMAVPIAMGSNKITGLTTATNNDEATNKGQMDSAIATALTPYLTSATAGTTYATQASVATAIAQAHQPFEIVRGSGSVRAETTGQITINPPTGQATVMSVNNVTKATLNATNLTMACPIAMGSNKISGLTTATNNDEATNKGQMDSAINTALSAYTPFQIARGSAYVNCETGGDISYYVPGSGNKHKFYVQGTLAPILQIEATSDLAVQNSHAQNAFYLWSNVFARGGSPNTTIWYSSGTIIEDHPTTDSVTLRGNVTVQPTTTNGNLLSVKNVAGTSRLTITNTGITSALPLAMGSNKITGLTTATNNDEATNKGQMDSAIATAVATVPTHNAYEIVRGTTSLSIDGGGVLALTMPINTASFNITDPSNTSVAMSAWTTQSSVSYNVNKCRTRVAHPTSGVWLQKWFNSTYGTANAQTEILSSDSMNLCVAGTTNHINFRHDTSSLIARMANDYFDTYVTTGQRIYTHSGSGGGVLRYTIDTSTTDVVITPANDSLSIKSKTIFQPQADSTTAFRFRKAGVTTAFIDIDTTNNVLNMNSNKITGVANATTSDGAVNKGQMDTAIASAVGTPTSITQGGGTVSASAVGQITINPASGQATVMSVAGVTKATLNTSNLTMACPIAMGSNKISGLTTATNNDEATNKGQMDSAIATALTPYLTSATASSTYATQASVSSAIANSHNPYELTRSGTVAYVRIVGDDVIHNSGTSGVIYNYYNSSQLSAIGSSGNEVYVADTGFRWRKGSSTGTEMFGLRAPSGTGQTQMDFPPDSVLWRGNTIIKPYASNSNTLQVTNLAGLPLATFVTTTTDADQRLDMASHRIRNVLDPVLDQDVATKKYVDDEVGNTYKQVLGVVRNPDMDINQRGTVSISTNGIFADGWKLGTPVHPAVTVSQEAITDLVGFNNCAKVVTTSASSTIIHIFSPTEGTYTQEFKFGYSSCVGATVSLWVKSSIVSHKFVVSILMNAWEVPSSATCSATANTWTRVSCYIPPSPSGIYAPTGNVDSIYICVNPSGPGNTTYGGTEQVWKNTTGGRASVLSDGTTNMMNIAGTQTFRFTGIQMDIGPVALPYRPQTFQQKLAHAQRYYYRLNGVVDEGIAQSCALYGTTHYFTVPLPVRMRTTPVCSSTVAFKVWSPQTGNYQNSTSVVNHTGASVERYGVYYTLASSYAYYSCLIQFGGTGAIIADADL